MAEKETNLDKHFQDDVKYRNNSIILSPHGVVREGMVLDGKTWKEVLVYGIDEEKGYFDEMFTEVKND